MRLPRRRKRVARSNAPLIAAALTALAAAAQLTDTILTIINHH